MQPAETCKSVSAAFMSVIGAKTKKPPTSISDTRLEMVMVKRSLEAANAIIAGKSVHRMASAIMGMARSFCASLAKFRWRALPSR